MLKRIQHTEGTVIHSQLYYNQNIYSSGGGGYVGSNGGYVSPPTIKSTTNVVHELFIRLPDNSDLHLKFNKDFQTIKDQKIYLISGFSSKDKGKWIALFNLNTRRLHYNVDDDTLKALGYYPTGNYDRLLLILHTGLTFSFLYTTKLFSELNSLGIAFGVTVLYAFVVRPRILSSYEREIKEKIDAYMENTFNISFK